MSREKSATATMQWPRPLIAYLSQALLLSASLCTSFAHAGPEGGVVTGGAGSISQSDITTTIQQTSQNMAIDWQSYNLNSNERVQYLQPNQSSISLNHILSNSVSEIRGRIDANGQVILVNPNGIFFTPESIINVGGIIASGLDIKTSDFMNGHYLFTEVMGSDGIVINRGTINASLGGNVALLGKQVENSGLIAASLGSVALAAGRQAILSFDDAGLLGVSISEAVLQDELGIDPAVLNSGTIQAAAGQVQSPLAMK
ncbi:MAG: filamentous hemagglutinin N-terminal domain-containing protein [Pseudomonadota bacterium]|nr:filamentous hemagglutinin N-terminal domain-containing protein [Pseudomonadota bacterium]